MNPTRMRRADSYGREAVPLRAGGWRERSDRRPSMLEGGQLLVETVIYTKDEKWFKGTEAGQRAAHRDGTSPVRDRKGSQMSDLRSPRPETIEAVHSRRVLLSRSATGLAALCPASSTTTPATRSPTAPAACRT